MLIPSVPLGQLQTALVSEIGVRRMCGVPGDFNRWFWSKRSGPAVDQKHNGKQTQPFLKSGLSASISVAKQKSWIETQRENRL
jgi:hypothetical protein